MQTEARRACSMNQTARASSSGVNGTSTRVRDPV